jgi:hypothetical protein
MSNPLEGRHAEVAALPVLSNVHVPDPDQIAFTVTISGALCNVAIIRNGDKRGIMDVFGATGQTVMSHVIVMAAGQRRRGLSAARIKPRSNQDTIQPGR